MTHAHCHDCGLLYGSDAWIEAIIPDRIWNKIRPSESGTGGGILCITCIARRLKIMRIDNVPVWLCGTENLVAHSNDPSEELATLRDFNS